MNVVKTNTDANPADRRASTSSKKDYPNPDGQAYGV